MGSGGAKKPVNGAQDKQVVTAIESVKEKSPLQKAIEAKAQKFYDWDAGTGQYAGQPKDVTAAPGMENYLDIYGNADRMAAQQRIGSPQAAFSGTSTANPLLLAQMKQQGQMQRYDARAQGLNQGLQGLRAEAAGDAQYSVGNQLQQQQAYAGMLSDFNNRFYNRPQRPALWQQIAGTIIGGAQAAGGLMSGAGAMGATF